MSHPACKKKTINEEEEESCEFNNMASSRYYLNPSLNSKSEVPLSNEERLHHWKKRIQQLSHYISQNQEKNLESVDGGLYVGLAGVAYAFYHVSISAVDLLDRRSWYLQTASEIISFALAADVPNKDSQMQLSFLLGDFGTIATALAIEKENGNLENKLGSFLKHLDSVAQMCRKVKLHACGSDEMFVGRSGVIFGSLWLRKALKGLSYHAMLSSSAILKDDHLLHEICDAIIVSGTSSNYSKDQRGLVFAYYSTEYIGAAHGISSILQALLSVPGYLETCSKEKLGIIRRSVDQILLLQSTDGNFPAATDETTNNHPLVHWCHGAPGVIYMLARAFLVWKDARYIQGALLAGECIWRKGLLKKGPGICHGVAGNGYAFLLLYKLTGDARHLYRAEIFAEFLYSDAFINDGALNRPDKPLSLYEGLSGTLCFLVDLLQPEHASFPFFDVFLDQH